MQTPSGPDSGSPLNLDLLMDRLRAEVQARKMQTVRDEAAAAAPPVPARPTAAVLLALPDAEFVRQAYAALFGRAPDAAEFTRLRDRLLTGQITRAGLLLRLSRQPEARRHTPGVDGLYRGLLLDRVKRSYPAIVAARLAHLGRVLYMLPKRIRQFLKRVDAMERTASEAALKTNVLEQKLAEASARLEALEQARGGPGA